MEREQGLGLLERTGLVAIVRGIPREEIVRVAEALYLGGIRVMEVTMNTEGAAAMIGALCAAWGDRIWIGAGTVTGVKEADEAAAAGARFYVTPNVNRDVIEHGLSRGMGICAGAMTPTEIVQAHAAGADIVKIFPCGSLGASYMKELQGPLGHIPMMAVGGITADNAGDYLRAGARAVGVGGNLVSRSAVLNGDYEGIHRLATEYVHVMKGVLEHD